MIAFLRGPLVERTDDGCVVEAAGVGYAVTLSAAAGLGLPAVGQEVRLWVVESVAMYGGGTTLYGFLTPREKHLYTVLRENVPGAGAKKALELLDRAAKSLADFRRAVINKDSRSLVALLGFTPKTAEKLVAALQDKMDGFAADGELPAAPSSAAFDEAVAGLVSLGYRELSARQAAQFAREALGAGACSQEILRESLRHLAGRGSS